MMRDPALEADFEKAVRLLRGIRAHEIEVIQPPHWMLEVASVIVRARPQRVSLMLGILSTLPFTESGLLASYRKAAEIAIRLNHHLFDTLYHAVALEERATLVTADQAHFGKAKDLGKIELLADFVM